MKNRIKKFYRDHQNEIVVAAATAAITMTIVSLRTAEACSVVEAQASQTVDGDIHVWVKQKNGHTVRFDGAPRQLDK